MSSYFFLDMKIAQDAKNDTVNLALDTIKRDKQALVFVNSKRSAQKQAIEISRVSNMATNELIELSDKILKAVSSPTDQCKKLAMCVKKGIAFHHAGLNSKQRTIIEDAFRAGTIKIICSTPTLAAGLDMPAFRTILKDMKRFSGNWGMQFIPVLEYEQMAGRAGRPGKEDYGEAILVCGSEKDKDELVEKYVFGDVENIYSKLAAEPVLRVYVLSLLATRFATDQKSLIAFFKKSFWAKQFGDIEKLEQIVTRVVAQLIEWKFVLGSAVGSVDKGFATAADLLVEHDEPLLVTPLGLRVSQLYLDPLSAHTLLNGFNKKTHAEFTLVGVLQLMTQALELRPLLRMKKAESEMVNEFLLAHEEELFGKIPTLYDVDYEDFYHSLKTTAYFVDWLDETGEDSLLKKYDIRPGEINAKNEMLDWLLYCMSELFHILDKKPDIAFLANIRARLKYGVREELLPLLKIKGVGRVRARKLFANGFDSISVLKKSSANDLAQILGKKLTVSVLKQLGVEAVVSEDVVSGTTKQTTLF